MEEADILSDRIVIMAKRRLRCIGTSIRLKSIFGTGYIATVSFPGNTPGHTSSGNGNNVDTSAPQAEIVKQIFKHHLNVDPKEESKAFVTFVIPHDKEALLAEKLMVNTLQMNMSMPTPYSFMMRFLKPMILRRRCSALSSASLSTRMLKFQLSFLAAAAIYTAQCSLKEDQLLIKSEGKLTSLDQYISRMKPEQKDISYITIEEISIS